MIILDFPQYSPDWWSARRGIPSASRASELITPTGKPSASAKKYLAELVAEDLGYYDEEFVGTDWMQRGVELEEEARHHYELDHGKDLETVGLVLNDDRTACCSPDALFDDRTVGWEAKCPMPKTHIQYVLEKELPSIYKAQVHYSMAVSGLDHWVFESYHPEMRSLTVDVERDDYTRMMEDALCNFLEQLRVAKEII